MLWPHPGALTGLLPPLASLGPNTGALDTGQAALWWPLLADCSQEVPAPLPTGSDCNLSHEPWPGCLGGVKASCWHFQPVWGEVERQLCLIPRTRKRCSDACWSERAAKFRARSWDLPTRGRDKIINPPHTQFWSHHTLTLQLPVHPIYWQNSLVTWSWLRGWLQPACPG